MSGTHRELEPPRAAVAVIPAIQRKGKAAETMKAKAKAGGKSKVTFDTRKPPPMPK